MIQLVRGAEWTAGERFIRRILPACVASAGAHLLLAGTVALFALINPVAAAKPSIQEVAVAVEDRPDTPESEDLTNTTPSLDDTLPSTALDTTDKLDTKTIETKLTEPEPAGNPDGTLKNPADSLLNVGTENPLITTPGMNVTGPGPGVIGGGSGGLNVSNPSFQGRGESTTRDALTRSNGGNKDAPLAVARGLAWLAKKQNKRDGGWEFEDGSSKDRAAATGMALLPFLAAGQTHKKSKGNDYQQTVTDGLNYLLKTQKADGSFSRSMYAHAIAAVAVCEAFGMTSDKAMLLQPAQKAVDFIEKSQGANGSWGYVSGTEGDTSIVGWQIQVLHSAKMCKELKVNDKVLAKAMRFLDTVASGTSKARYGYRDAKSVNPTRTAVGLLCRYYLNGWGKETPGMREGVEYLMTEHAPGKLKGVSDERGEYDMYYYYYATQVLHFHGGDAEWKNNWSPKMSEYLVNKQRKESSRPEIDGSWDADSSQWIGANCGRVGTTCMALLTLEVYYRHLPLYNRGTGGKVFLEGK